MSLQTVGSGAPQGSNSMSSDLGSPSLATAKPRQWLPFFLIPAGLLLCAFFVVPLLVMGWRSLTDPDLGLSNFEWVLGDSTQRAVVVRTFLTAFWVTSVCLLLGYPYAYAMTIAGPRLRLVLILLVLVPFWTSLMVRTLAWVLLLQDNGLINGLLGSLGLGQLSLIRTTSGVVLGMSQILLPFMVLPLYSAMSNIDRRLLQASASLGAKPLVTFLKVWLPLSLPGVGAGVLLVSISSLGFYVTPALLGSPRTSLISQQIYTQINLIQWGRGAAMGVILLGLTLSVIVASAILRKLAGRKNIGGAR